MRITLTTLCAAFALSASALPAQTPDTARTHPEPLFTRTDALYAGGFIVAAAALAPLDRSLDDALQEPAYQGRRALSGGATVFRLLGNPGAAILSVSTYAGGRLVHRPGLADAGLHTAESILMANVVTGLTKGLVGRARPFVSPNDPYDVKLGRGIGDDDYESFPSGHTSTAFAAAAAATHELGRWAPHYRVPGGIVLYSGATLVGLSRMYNQRHWATDVAVGAAIGTFSGWKVVTYNHDHPENRFDRLFLRTAVLPSGNGGVAVLFSLPH